MRSIVAFVLVSASAGLMGCAATTGQERVVVAVDAPAARSSSEVVEITEVVQPVAAPAAPNRPRLAQTVTLGQGGAEAVYTAASVPQQAQGNPGGVVVNNNITVVGSPPVYGGYGYGSVGARDYGRGSGSTSRSGAWAPSGWEGAGRTAAPGHTPGVGGNWAPPPSHGPRSLK
jgi:hypothetical protein